MYVTPSTTTITKDSTFTVTVRADTEGQSINVAEATVSFPSDKLAIVKATPGSTFPIQSPGSPKISKNQVFFSAGIPTPGYTGKNGIVGTITFRAIAPGAAMLKVESGKILLNDGKATDAFVQKASATINVKDVSPTQPSVPVQPAPEYIEEEIPEEVITPTLPPPTQVSVQEPNQSDVVTTITIRVKDLVRIVYVLAILLGIFIIISLYLFVTNINLRHKNKSLREMSKL